MGGRLRGVIRGPGVTSGNWSDYVFAGGTRIARATNFEHQLHISGQVCANCGWQWYEFNFTNLGGLAGRTIQAGDTLRWLAPLVKPDSRESQSRLAVASSCCLFGNVQPAFSFAKSGPAAGARVLTLLYRPGAVRASD